VVRASRVGGTVIGGAPLVGGTTFVGGPTVVGGGFRSSRVVGTTYGAPIGGTTTTTYTTGGVTTLPGQVLGGGVVYGGLPSGTLHY